MDAPSPSIRRLARRLLAVEAARQDAADVPRHEAVRVCQTLRDSLTRFAGADGFTSLMRRALALARAEIPSINGVQLNPERCLQELESLAADSGIDASEAAASVIAHLLGLLVTFIGEPLALRLVSEAWPDVAVDR